MPAKKSTTEEKKAPKKEKKTTKVKDESPKGEKKRERKKITKESFQKDLFEIYDLLNTETTAWQEKKAHGVKFLKTLRKRLGTLKNNSFKALKIKRASKRASENSGFKKKRTITKPLAEFAQKAKIEYYDLGPKGKKDEKREILNTYHTDKWSVDQKQCRNDVTKAICKYIERENLQNPKDKRVIVPDAPLKKLLGSDYEGDLTYYKLQKLISKLFVPEPKEEKKKAPAKKKAKKDEEKPKKKAKKDEDEEEEEPEEEPKEEESEEEEDVEDATDE